MLSRVENGKISDPACQLWEAFLARRNYTFHFFGSFFFFILKWQFCVENLEEWPFNEVVFHFSRLDMVSLWVSTCHHFALALTWRAACVVVVVVVVVVDDIGCPMKKYGAILGPIAYLLNECISSYQMKTILFHVTQTFCQMLFCLSWIVPRQYLNKSKSCPITVLAYFF